MSLRRLHGITNTRGHTILPGHGPPVPAASATISQYISHREEREEQVPPPHRPRVLSASASLQMKDSCIT